MRALVLAEPGRFVVEERPTPQPAADEVTLRMHWGGICGSDLAYWRSGVSGTSTQRAPFVLGHEGSGTVVGVGADVTGVAVGSRVTVHPARIDGELPSHLAGRENLAPALAYLGSAATTPHTDGVFADELVVRAAQVRVLPNDVPFRRAALAEPLAVALHAVARSGGVHGRDVLVSGCGPIGALVVLACVKRGAHTVTAIDPSPSARTLARALGATAALDVTETVDSLVTVGFEAAGNAASLATVLATVAAGSVVVQVGNLPLTPTPAPLGLIVSREIDYRGSYRFVDEITDAVVMLADSPEVDVLQTHDFWLDDADAAFATAASEGAGKVMLRIADV